MEAGYCPEILLALPTKTMERTQCRLLDKSGLIGLGVMEQGDHFLQRNPSVDNREDTGGVAEIEVTGLNAVKSVC